jgi:hypothetical protein
MNLHYDDMYLVGKDRHRDLMAVSAWSRQGRRRGDDRHDLRFAWVIEAALALTALLVFAAALALTEMSLSGLP